MPSKRGYQTMIPDFDQRGLLPPGEYSVTFQPYGKTDMIRTDAEYKRALEKLKQDACYVEQQRSRLQEMGLSTDEEAYALQPALSFTAQLKEEIETYERMRRGDLGPLFSFAHIGRWLVGARIALDLTQQELAERLGVSAAQVSRDERNDYHGITVERAQRILEALGVQFRAEAANPVFAERDLGIEYA